MAWLVQQAPMEYACVAERLSGNWIKRAERGRSVGSLPWTHASDATDVNVVVRHESWWLRSLCQAADHQFVLCLQTATIANNIGLRLEDSRVNDYAAAIASGLVAWQTIQAQQRDVQRMTHILTVAADWHQHLALDRLLESIALTATKLLNGDRASIFLWDKQSRELVGHPALGIEGKPLRIADDAGLAGAVLKSLEPRRWDRSDPADEVNRRVDNRIGYRTDSLVAVPLIDPRGSSAGGSSAAGCSMTDFFFDGAAVPGRPEAQIGFDGFVEFSDGQAGHGRASGTGMQSMLSHRDSIAITAAG